MTTFSAENEERVGNLADARNEPFDLVADLLNNDRREAVLLQLSKTREQYADLAPILWHSFGAIAVLLQEVTSIYPYLQPPRLTTYASNRVCNALALIQCVASHKDTRASFLAAQIPLYLYPFLNTTTKTKSFEYLRVTSLGVIGALVKVEDTDVIKFLLSTEIIPLCLRIMEHGSSLSMTVATFIIQRILQDDIGLEYICQTQERYSAVCTVLNNMISLQAANPEERLLKHLFRSYARLMEHPRAREALHTHSGQELAQYLNESTIRTFEEALQDDQATKTWLQKLVYQLQAY